MTHRELGLLWRAGSPSPSLLVRLCLEVRPWLLPPLLLLLLLQAEDSGARCWGSEPTLCSTLFPTLFRCSPADRGRRALLSEGVRGRSS